MYQRSNFYTCISSCTLNSHCLSNYYCNDAGACVADLADGSTCTDASYANTVAEDEGVCINECDNDGVGLTDNGHCYTPNGASSRYDSVNGTCEYDAGNGADLFADERAGEETYSNKASSSEYMGCPAYSSCVVGTTSCTTYDGDQQSLVCGWVGGTWTTVTTVDYEVDNGV